MFKKKTLSALALAVALCAAPGAFAAQKKSKKKSLPRGTRVLWRGHEVEKLDLLAGPGGKSMRPDLRRLRVLEEETGGFSPKYRVRDASGRVWVAKLGRDRKSTRLNSSHANISYAVFCLKKKKEWIRQKQSTDNGITHV